MGFKRKKPTTIEMTFDGDYEGLKMSFKMPSIGEYIEFIRVAGKLALVDDDADTETLASSTEEMIDQLLRFTYSWNMEDEDGNAVPLNKEELKKEDVSFLMLIGNALGSAFGGVDADLGKDSGSGETSLMNSIPMDIS
jgi:hypothetical protein